MSEWYYSYQGRQQGPVSRDELRRLAVSGTIKPTDMIWKEGMPNWVPANTTKGLFPDAEPETPRRRDAPGDRPPRHAVTSDDRPPRRPRRRDVHADRDRDEVSQAPANKPSRKGMLFAIVGGVGLLLAGGVVAIFMVTRGEKDTRTFTLRQGGSKEFEIQFEKGKWVEVNVESDGPRGVDLYVFDNNRQQVASHVAPGNDCTLKFIPKKTQTYFVEVRSRNDFFGFLLPDEDYVDGKVRWKLHDLSTLAETANQTPATINDAITGNDRNPNNNEFAKEFMFHFDKKQFYTIEMFSQFNNHLEVKNIYGETAAMLEANQREENARLFFQPPEPGVYTIFAGSGRTFRTGPFTLNVRAKTADDDSSRAFRVRSGNPVRFSVPFTQQQLVEVAVKEDNNAKLELRVFDARNVRVASLQSAANGSRILFVPPRTESYRVEVVISNRFGMNPALDGILQWNVKPMTELTKLSRKAPSTIGDTLSRNDPTMGFGKYFKSYLFQFDAGKTYTLDMFSQMENDITVHDLSGKSLASVPSTECGRNSRLFFTPAATGVFKVIASPNRGHNTGPFSLTVREKSAADDVSRPFSLAPSHSMHFQVPLQRGKLFEFSLQSKTTDKMELRIIENRFRTVNSSVFENGKGSLLLLASNLQPYRIEVRNAGRPGLQPASGFVLWRERSLADFAKNAQTPPANINNVLTTKDVSFVPTKLYCKLHLFQLQANQIYTFEMFSQYDNYLYLQDVTGKQLAFNDDGGPGLNAKIVFRAPAAGVYRVVATSITGRYTGPFNLRVSAGLK